MEKGRSPCCDKSQVKRGHWSPAEDLRLTTFIQKHGHPNWRALPKQAGLLRCRKSCRLRWINYLRPDLKRGNFTREDEDSIIRLHQIWGNKWSKISAHFPGRTDNEIKNVWNTHLKKRLAVKNFEFCGDESKEMSSITSFPSSSSSSNTSFVASGKQSVAGELEHQFAGQEISTGNKKPHESCCLTIPDKLDHQDSSIELTNQFLPDPKDLRDLNSSSVSSNDSNGSSFTQVDFSRPAEEKMDDLFDFSEPYDIPLESDHDFWSMIDGFVPFQSNEVLVNQADEAYQSSSNLGQVENEKWLGYLKRELGLDQATTKSDQNNQDILTRTQLNN